MSGLCLNSFQEACRRVGAQPSRYVFAVKIGLQRAYLFEAPDSRFIGRGRLLGRAPALTIHRKSGGLFHYRLLQSFICSTSKFGIGEQAGSNKTPRGLHQITEKIGDGCPVGTIFKSRKVVGYTWEGKMEPTITTRIMWLDGLEPGFNRGGNVDSHERYIYIHGTGDESTVGRPASHGCVQLAAKDLVPLFNRLPLKTLVWIEP